MKLKKTMTLAALMIGAALTPAVYAADEVLVLGVNDSLTGGGAVYGLPQANAVQMAADEINPDCPLETASEVQDQGQASKFDESLMAAIRKC